MSDQVFPLPHYEERVVRSGGALICEAVYTKRAETLVLSPHSFP